MCAPWAAAPPQGLVQTHCTEAHTLLIPQQLILDIWGQPVAGLWSSLLQSPQAERNIYTNWSRLTPESTVSPAGGLDLVIPLVANL